MEGEQLDSYISQGYEHYVKYKQYCLGFVCIYVIFYH